MKIKVICLGKLKEDYYKDGVEHYSNIIKKYNDIEIIEILDEKLNNKLSEAETIKILEKEEVKILDKINKGDFIITLAIKGEISSTNSLKKVVTKCKNENRDIVFIIGSSFGLSENIYKVSNLEMSFSKMTFTHQMMRFMLLEQISLVFE